MNTSKLVYSIILTAVLGLLATTSVLSAEELPDYPQIAVETSAGNFNIELFYGRAPLTVRNFVDYVESGFYEGVVFHRVMAGFVVQAGGYDTDYKKKPTQAFVPNESGNGLSNRRGFIAMARTTEPHSANSQFFINLGDNLTLDPRPTRWGYTVFGRVTEGMDAVDQIGYVATGPGPIPELVKDVPTDAVVITRMTLLHKQDSEVLDDMGDTVNP